MEVEYLVCEVGVQSAGEGLLSVAENNILREFLVMARVWLLDAVNTPSGCKSTFGGRSKVYCDL